MTIRLHIDRVIVDGLSLAPGDADDLRAALESRLVELFTDRALGSIGAMSAAGVRPDAIEASPGMGGAVLGASAAAALHDGLVGSSDAARPRGGTRG